MGEGILVSFPSSAWSDVALLPFTLPGAWPASLSSAPLSRAGERELGFLLGSILVIWASSEECVVYTLHPRAFLVTFTAQWLLLVEAAPHVPQ